MTRNDFDLDQPIFTKIHKLYDYGMCYCDYSTMTFFITYEKDQTKSFSSKK